MTLLRFLILSLTAIFDAGVSVLASSSTSILAQTRPVLLLFPIDNEALARFRVDHRIPNNVVIERSGPNNDADWWEFQADDPGLFSILRQKGYIPVGFNARFWRRYDRCAATIIVVNNCRRTCKVVELLCYVLTYRYTIPHRADHRGQPRLPPLRIHDQALRQRSSFSIEVSNFIEGSTAELRQLREDTEGESTGSSGSNSLDSSSSWDVDLGGDEEERDEDAEVEKRKGRQPTEGTSCQKKGKGIDHETYVALGNAIILLQDVVDLTTEDSEKFACKLLMMGAQLLQQAMATSACLKKHTTDLKKANQKIHGLEKELNHLHLFHSCLCGDCSKITLFGYYLVSVKGLFSSGSVEATPFIRCNQSQPTIALYGGGMSTMTNSVTNSWVPA
ncbi:hypothetical protein Acr_11g0011000 [Actinidia rufa]|uniref:Uncharacterized protein n=1 Tax=Actinidia rufa TaxID=165716 RepID=A0A7J0FDL6_9ERIC|nr:hypothetical protein Acr_11g0011000 [Actinidia rufa]